MKQFFSPHPFMHHQVLAVVRITVGLLMIYHGQEVFNSAKIVEYAAWKPFEKYSSAESLIYLGKGAELFAGVFLTLGLFTRLAALVLIGTMLFIILFIGQGRIWFEEQHPFLFLLLGLVFLFYGGGRWSADHFFFAPARYSVLP
jgi:putative oxidoreductase